MDNLQIKKKDFFLIIPFFIIICILILQPIPIIGLFAVNIICILSVILINFLLKNRMPRLNIILVLSISLVMTLRYIFWRTFTTLHFPNIYSAIFGIFLYLAELYSWCVLFIAFFQSLSPLNRPIVPLPTDSQLWPDVDIFIPTYNESLGIVKITVYGAINLEWPKNKIKIWLLDDGKRSEFKSFAHEVGVNYLARSSNNHAKAGNLNYALKHTQGEYIAIFDCDHVANQDFLIKTMGWFFKDKNLALIQTPHYFFSPDPIERNLKIHRKIPSENNLFYGVIQDGNDTWNSTFFCGSCAILKREPLEEVGGVAVETVTEDAHTSLKMHKKGYTSAYLKTPLSAGLATETFSGHVGQRIRWARGMTQILRIDNPLFSKNLSIPQKVCYTGVMIHYLSCISRIIFLFSPLAFLLFHNYIISASAILIFLYVVPHLFLSIYTNYLVQGKYRHSFFSEIYETILCFYTFIPVAMALIAPHKGKFNVTSKGGLIKEKYVDFNLLIPIIFSCILLVLGVGFGIYRLMNDNLEEFYTILFSLAWCFYNLIILGSCIYVSIETKQIRQSHRVNLHIPVRIKTNFRNFICELSDFSATGMGIKTNIQLDKNEQIESVFFENHQTDIPVVELYRKENHIGLCIQSLSHEQSLLYVSNTFGRSGIWADELESLPKDKMYRSFFRFFKYGIAGYYRLYRFLKIKLKQKIKYCY